MASASRELPAQPAPAADADRADGHERGSPSRPWLAWSLRVVAIAGIGFGIWYLLRGLGLDALGTALGKATPWPILIAVFFAFANLWCKAACWRLFLDEYQVTTWRLFRCTIAAFAMSAILPARAGEVLRVWMLKSRDGIPASVSTAVAVTEKLLDGVSLALLMAPLPWLLPHLPRWVGTSIAAVAFVGTALLVALTLMAGRIGGSSWFGRFLGAMRMLRRPGPTLASLGVLVLSWVFDLGMIQLTLWALDIELPWAASLLILFTVNLAIIVPAMPGAIGALELGAMVALKMLGVAKEPALAFALIYHALQIVPIVLVGLILDGKLIVRRPQRATTATVQY